MNPYVDGKTIKISKELLTKFRIIVSWDEAIREKDLESRRPWWGGGVTHTGTVLSGGECLNVHFIIIL